jgi:hypothetical protein
MTTLMTSFVVGTTIITELTVKDKNGNAYDPSTVTYTVKDPAGATVVNNAAMTKDGVGAYHGDYTPTVKVSTDEVDKYAIWAKCTNGSRVTVAHCTASVTA